MIFLRISGDYLIPAGACEPLPLSAGLPLKSVHPYNECKMLQSCSHEAVTGWGMMWRMPVHLGAMYDTSYSNFG